MKARLIFSVILLIIVLVLSLGGLQTAKAQKPEPPEAPKPTPTLPLELKHDLEHRAAPLEPLSAPPNDDFDAALLITTLPYQHSIDTRAATVAPDDPDMGCGAGVNSNTVWYRLVPSFHGIIEANTFGNDYDTVLAIFTGVRDSLNRIACNDDASGTLQSQVTFEVEAGRTYYLEVADYDSLDGGELRLTLRADPLLFVNSPTDLYMINLTTGNVTHIGPFGAGIDNMTDIAFLGNKLYGVSFNTLYSINPSDGHATVIGRVGYSSVNSLEAINNTLYAATGDREFLIINEMTGRGTLVGRFPPGQTPAGDLALLYGTLYIAFDGSPDKLGTVNPSDGSTSIVGSIGYEGVLGLAGVGSSLYGVTEDYGRILRIDTDTGTGYDTGYYIGSGDRFWGMTGYANTAPTSNDDFDHADELAEPPPNGLANQILDTDTNDATVAPDDPDMGCGTGVNSHTLWYKLTPSYYGLMRLRTYNELDPAGNSTYDTVVAVFTGQRGSLHRVACNDDAPGHGTLSDLTFEVEAGRTYYIEVASYGDFPGGTLSLFYNYEVSPKAWTLMFFTAGDNDINQETRLTRQYALLAQASKNLNVNIVVFWDGVVSDARYDVFSPTYGNDRILKGELSTGDPGVLQDFVRWAIQNYPAENYALIISDHGHGISGVAIDRDPSVDTLTVKELRQALLPLPKIDVLYMDACLMGTLDSAYELNGLIDYYVASESVTWGSIRPDWFILGTPGGELSHITQDTSSRDLAIAMAQSYEMAHMSEYQPSTISVVDVAAVGDVATKTSALASLIKNRMSGIKQILDGILTDVQRFDERDLPWVTNRDRLIDLYHFTSLVRSRIADTDIQNAATSLLNSINNYVIFNSKWSGWATVNGDRGFWNHENAYGVSVLFPSPDTRECYYNGDWVGFAAGTDWHCQGSSMFALSSEGITFEWGPMLVEYLEQTNPSAPDNWNPPELVAPLTLSQVYLPVILRSSGSTPSPTPTPTPTPPPSSPAIRVEPTSGPLGTRFNIYGSGFIPGESVQQWVITPSGDRFDDPTPHTVDSQGNYTSWIQIDYGPTGTYTLYARGNQSQQTVSAQFQITSSSARGVETSRVSQIVWSR